jgi:hypothetical protein
MNNHVVSLLFAALLFICLNCVAKNEPPSKPQLDAGLSEKDKSAILNRQDHHLGFQNNDTSWWQLTREETNSRMEKTDIFIVLDGIVLEKGDAGLENLAIILNLLPPGTTILANHHLICEENRWSKKIRALSKKYEEKRNVSIHCNGAF